MVQAARGDRIEVPTLEGPVEFAIPAGTQHGQSFRLQGRGMPDVRGGRRGDQYVVGQIVIPKDLDPGQKSLLRKVGGVSGKRAEERRVWQESRSRRAPHHLKKTFRCEERRVVL